MPKSDFNIQSLPKSSKLKFLGADFGSGDKSAIAMVDYAGLEAKVLAHAFNTGEVPKMPVTFGKPQAALKPVSSAAITGKTFLTALGIPEEMISLMHAQTVKCIVGTTSIRFERFLNSKHSPGSTYFTGDSVTAAQLPIMFSTAKAVVDGTLPELDKTQLCSVFYQTIQDILEGNVQKPISGTLALLKAGAAKGADAALPGGAAMQYDTPTKVHIGHPAKDDKPGEFPVSELESATPVKLRDANKLYQPTRGTSKGSRYYVIAIGKELKLSCRYQNTSLSLRVEGQQFMEHIKTLNELGMTAHADKGYASVHLTAPDEPTARKIVGAFIMGLGITITTGLPDLSKIVGK